MLRYPQNAQYAATHKTGGVEAAAATDGRVSARAAFPDLRGGHGIAHGRLPIDFRHATTMALMAPVIAARELCCCSIPGARTAACAAEQFLGASFVQALVCAQAAPTSTIRDGFGRAPFAPCSCPSLACLSAAARSACSSAVARARSSSSGGGGPV